MQFFGYLTLLAAALPLAATAPTDGAVEARTQQGFTLTQQATGRTVTKNGPKSRLKALKKFGGNFTSDLEAAAKQQGTVAASPESGDIEYLSPVTLGSNTLMLDIDSGSSDLWAFSSQQSAADRGQHAFYQTNESKRLAGQTFHLTYGDNSMAEGVVYADKVVVGGVTATRQAVEAATSVSADFTQDVDSDGIFGFGFNNNNNVQPTQQRTWFDTIKATLPKPLWTATLKKGAPGSYDFGFINPNKYQGTITYRPVNSAANGVWQFLCGGYYVGNTKYGDGPLTFSAIVDTGTSVMLLKDQDVVNYYNNVPNAQYVPNAGGFVFPCNTALPDFSLIVNNQRRRVPGSYINYQPLGVQNYCFGGIQPNGGLPFAILGDVFIKSQFIVFDTSGPQIGFAQQKGIPNTV